MFKILLLVFCLVTKYSYSNILAIPFNLEYQNKFFSQTTVLISENFKVEGLDCQSFVESTNLIFKKEKILKHPFKDYYCKNEILSTDVINEYDLNTEIDIDDFKIKVEIPLKYFFAKDISLKNELVPTLKSEDFRGWVNFSGNFNKNEYVSTKHNGIWKLQTSYKNTHLSTIGNYYSEDIDNIQSIKDNLNLKQIYKKYDNNYELQVGRVYGTKVVPGQSSSSKRGVSFSNIINNHNLILNVSDIGDGEIIIDEDSDVEFYINDLLLKKMSLKKGKYNIKNLVTAPGENQFKIRIESKSGVVSQKIINIETSYTQLNKGQYNYTLYSGELTDTNYKENGFAIIYAPTNSTNIGVHYNHINTIGYRNGYSLNYYLKNFNIHFNKIYEKYLTTNLNSNTNIDISFNRYSYHFEKFKYKNDTFDRSIKFEHKITAIFPLPLFTSFSTSFGVQNLYNKEKNNFLNLYSGKKLAKNLYLSSSYNYKTYPEKTHNISLSMTYSFGKRSSVNYTYHNKNKREVGFNSQFLKDTSFSSNYSKTEDSKTNRSRLQYKNNYLDLSFTSNWNKLKNWQNTNNSIHYNTAIVFTKNAFAVVPKVNSNFLLVDTSAISKADKIAIKMCDNSLNNLFDTFVVSDTRAGKLVVDPSEVSYCYDIITETIVPNKFDGYYLKINNNKKIIIMSKLLLPNKQLVKLLYGQLTNKETKEKAEWFTDKKGIFYFEGFKGIWEGKIYLNNKIYKISLSVDSEEDLLSLEPINLILTK